MKQKSSFLSVLCLPFMIGIILTVNLIAADDLNRSYTYITFQQVKDTPLNINSIPRSELRSRIVLARTNLGNYAKLELASGDDLHIDRIEVYNPSGCILFEKANLIVRSSFSFDIDTAIEKIDGADFWWHGISAGVHELVPQNGARFIAYKGFDQIGFNDMRTLEYKTTRIPRSILRKQILLARTKEGRFAKLLLAAGDNLLILRLVTYNADGSVKVDKSNFVIRSSFFCNLDTGQESAVSSDFWWHGISAGVHYLEPGNGAGIYFPSYYSMVKYESLLGNDLIKNTAVWEGTAGAKNFNQWPYEKRIHLTEMLFAMENEMPFPIDNPPAVTEDRYFSECDAWMIYLSHVSHSLWVDANRKVNWSLTSLSADNLAYLLDSRKLFNFSAAKQKYYFDVMGHVSDWNVKASYDFMTSNRYIKAAQDTTVYAFGDWCRAHLIHISGVDSNPDGYQRLYGYRGLPLVNRILIPLAGQNHITAGCWGTSGFFAAVMRSVNIPVVHGRSTFSYPGSGPGTHSRIEIPTINRGLTHSDDFYNAILLPSGDIVPTNQIFVSTQWLKDNVDNPVSLDCNGAFCNRKEDQASYNAEKYLLSLAVNRLTDYLLFTRANDASINAPATNLLNVLTGPSVGGVVVIYPKPYYTPAERQAIVTSVDNKLQLLGGGDWNAGKAIVLTRWNNFQNNR